MSDAFLAGTVVGFVLGVVAVFVGLLALAWREEQIVLRSMQGGIDNDDDD